MDFRVVGLEGFAASETTATATATANSTGLTLVASDSETKHKLYGSGFLKQQRSGNAEDDFRVSKLPKVGDFSVSKAMPPQHTNTSSPSPSNNTSIFFDVQQQQQMLSFSAPKSEALSMERTSQNLTFPYCHLTKHAGYHSGGISGANMNVGAFTPSQWMELEHQALIYKYITTNVPIPSNLLIPITKALDSAGFSCFSAGPLTHNTLGWGAFHVGFSNNSDPEPGRCRRTDGKKWRCSRDAVADQKYCERHMNRGRHRSRKPVEGQSGHAATKLVSSSSASVVGPTGGSGESNSLKNLLPAGKSNPMNRLLMNKDSAAGNEFGVVSPESLLNPSHNSPSLVKCIDFGCSQETFVHHHQFIDGWPRTRTRTQCDPPSISWPAVDRTQLSISIPMVVLDESAAPSPLRLSHEHDPIQISSVGDGIPISWEGPLAEALHSTNSSALNLVTQTWDHSRCFGSSPTGVLQ